MLKLIYMGTALYLSALALDAVTSIGIDVGVVITAVVCTIYTTLVSKVNFKESVKVKKIKSSLPEY